ncbi:hypothetical protein Tco_0049299 [Tanacetum coccineum]
MTVPRNSTVLRAAIVVDPAEPTQRAGGRSARTYPSILEGNSDLLAKRRRNRVIIPLESIPEGENPRCSADLH